MEVKNNIGGFENEKMKFKFYILKKCVLSLKEPFIFYRPFTIGLILKS